MCGIWVEEIDALPSGKKNTIKFGDNTIGNCQLLCDLLHLEGAESLAEYDSDFYRGMPVVTKNNFGNGCVYYVGSMLDESSQVKFLDEVIETAKIKPLTTETKLEVTRRQTATCNYYFVINFQSESQPLPAEFIGKIDLLKGTKLLDTSELAPYDVAIIEEKNF